MIDLKNIGTERRNERTKDIDRITTVEILHRINQEDVMVPAAVGQAVPQITRLVDKIVEAFQNDGRLIYVGAGTSGRIGILDAVECRPTFGVDDQMVQCLMAGGMPAMVKAVEGAEDSVTMSINDLNAIHLQSNDVVVGITASGRTPYAVSAVQYAKSVGCVTGCITTSPNSVIASACDFPIEAITGAEPITGSTRMKSGTAQKLICNMLSTASMIHMGKVYENLMIDVQPTNVKLNARARNIIMDITGVDASEADQALEKYKSVKKALFALLSGVEDIIVIDQYLSMTKGHLRKAILEVQKR